MAATLTAQLFPHAGGAVNYSTTVSGGLAQTGNTTPCGPGLALLVKNASGSSIDVRVKVPAGVTADGIGIGNATPGSGFRPVTVANNADAIIPLPIYPYQDPSTGLAGFDFSATPTSVSVACISTN